MKKIGLFLRHFSRNFFFQWFFILIFLLAVRGSEGLGVPVNLDVNDTIVFSEIAVNQDFPVDSISGQFVRATQDVGLILLPGRLMQAMGLSAESQFFVLYALQMVALSLGLLVFFSAFNRDFGFIFLSVLLAFVSGFTGFGRYLALGAGFKIVSSAFAMTLGFTVLGLHMHGRRYAAAVMAALLAAYHPSHGFVLLFILGCHALWECFVAKEKSFIELLKLGAVTTLALLPFVLLVVLRLPPSGDFSADLWWDYVFSKTSNLTPLQDGVLVVIGIMAALFFGITALRVWPQTDSKETILKSQRAIIIIVAVMLLWPVQIFVTEIWRSIPLTQLALTRATPYAVLVLIAVFAAQAYRAFMQGSAEDKMTGLFLVLGVMGAALPQYLPVLGIPTGTPAIIRTEMFFQGNVIEQANIAFLMAALAWWMWLPCLSALAQRKWAIILLVGTFAAVFLFGFRCPFLAIFIMIFLHFSPQVAHHFPISKIAIQGMIFLAAAILILGRDPWRSSEAHEIRSLLMMVESNVPRDAMILTLPPDAPEAEILIPSRAVFLGWGEAQYLIYLPYLAGPVWDRARLLGLNPVSDSTCLNWLWRPMCRRQAFSKNGQEKNDIWRGNIKKMKKIAPSLSYVLMPAAMACRTDRIQDRSGNLVLIPLGGVAGKGCR